MDAQFEELKKAIAEYGVLRYRTGCVSDKSAMALSLKSAEKFGEIIQSITRLEKALVDAERLEFMMDNPSYNLMYFALADEWCVCSDYGGWAISSGKTKRKAIDAARVQGEKG